MFWHLVSELRLRELEFYSSLFGKMSYQLDLKLELVRVIIWHLGRLTKSFNILGNESNCCFKF